MFKLRVCNDCAVYRLIAVLAVLLFLSVPAEAEVFFNDDTGVSSQGFGFSVSELNDINDDGLSEFLVGAPGQSPGGRVFLYFGGTGLPAAGHRFWNGVAGEKFGWSVANIGDVNNDDTDDWAVGAPLANNGGDEAGRVYVFYGGANPSSTADKILDGEFSGDQFGYSISAAGDFNGDGYDDFIVGAPFSDLDFIGAGAAYIIYGSGSGPSINLDNATTLNGAGANDSFGWSVTRAGNFLNTGETCVAVGAPLNNADGPDAGRVYVYKGTTGGATPNSGVDFTLGIGSSVKAGSQYGFVVRGIGRWNFDSIDDLAVGAPNCNVSGIKGRVEIIEGGSSPSSDGDFYVNGQGAGDLFGYSLARGYDISGSSAEDLIIGAPGHNDGGTDTGRTYIYEGNSPSYNSASSLVIVPVNSPTGNVALNKFGTAVAVAADSDGDSEPDLLVGAPDGPNVNAALAGYCYLDDSSGVVVPAFLSQWSASWATDMAANISFSVAIAADEITTVRVWRELKNTDTGRFTSTEIFNGVVNQSYAPSDDPLSYDGRNFVLRDSHLESQFVQAPTFVQLYYSLQLTTTTGNVINLDSLAGPSLAAAPWLLNTDLVLDQAWPNPCLVGSSELTVSFSAPANQKVLCQIVDLRGRLVRQIFSGTASGSGQRLVWDGRTSNGQQVAAGIYFVRLQGQGQVQTKQVILTR